MANYSIETIKTYKVVADYDNDNGDVVKNETNVDYSGTRDDLTGWKIGVALTKEDGKTLDETTVSYLLPGESVTFESGLGSGRKIVILTNQENRSTFEVRTDTITVTE